MLCLALLPGCHGASQTQGATLGDPVDVPLLLNNQLIGLRNRAEPFEGVVTYLRSHDLRSDEGISIIAVEGKDIELIFLTAVMTREGAFVREGGIGLKDDDSSNFVGPSMPFDSGWDVVNLEGVKIGRLFRDRDPVIREGYGEFGATLYGGHARRNWSHIEGRESVDHINPNTMICCIMFETQLTIPFSEIKPTGEWGTVLIPMWTSVYYYDIAERRYEKASRSFELTIHFNKPSD